MNLFWENIAESLRGEVSEYGRLLHLIQEQQRSIFRRDVEGVLCGNQSIQAQVDILHGCRRRREQLSAAFAAENGQPKTVTLRALVPLIAPEGRPLLEALIGEINRLIHRVRRAMRLNQRLLASTLEFHQELLRRLRPDAFTKTYASDGRVSLSTPQRVPSMQIAG